MKAIGLDMPKVKLSFYNKLFYFDEKMSWSWCNGVVFLLLNESVKEQYAVKFFNSKRKLILVK